MNSAREDVNRWAIDLKDRRDQWRPYAMRLILERMDQCTPDLWKRSAHLQVEYERLVEIACECLVAVPNNLFAFQLGARITRDGIIGMHDELYRRLREIIERLLIK